MAVVCAFATDAPQGWAFGKHAYHAHYASTSQCVPCVCVLVCTYRVQPQQRHEGGLARHFAFNEVLEHILEVGMSAAMTVCQHTCARVGHGPSTQRTTMYSESSPGIFSVKFPTHWCASTALPLDSLRQPMAAPGNGDQ